MSNLSQLLDNLLFLLYNLSMQKLVECIPNFSEGRNIKVIKAIFNVAQTIKTVKVFGLEYNKDHNRFLFTILGAPQNVMASVFASIRTAVKLIDMEKHRGEHPRIGAVDVVPFVPVSGVAMKECVALAKQLGKKVAKKFHIPVYLYEAAATRPNRRNLADIRKGEYENLKTEIKTNKDRKPDYGPCAMHPTAGAVVIGARKYLIAFNVNLDTKSVAVGKKIASRIREKNGGLPGVKALCFKVAGYAQVSMNLVDFEKTNFDEAFRAIEKEAKRFGARIRSSEIYGMIPLMALMRAVQTTFNMKTFTADQVLEKKIYE